MMKIDNGTASDSKIFQLNDEDIELIVRLLHEESDCHVYQKDFGETCLVWQTRYDHMQDLIIELTK
tara:strand:+ start:289 stop:486 length:198 start_codon:yes stop_codon:yes gene_type:complete